MKKMVLIVCGLVLALMLSCCGGVFYKLVTGGSSRAAAAVTEFDPNNRDRTAWWWAGHVNKLVEAKASGNEVRVEETMKEIDTARQSLIGQRIRYVFNVWQTNPDLPETVWDYKPISSQGVWVGALVRADNARVHVGVKYHDTRMRGYIYAFQLKPGEDFDPSLLKELTMKSTFEVSARISQTGVSRLDTWHQGFGRYTTPPTLLLFIEDIKVEKVNP